MQGKTTFEMTNDLKKAYYFRLLQKNVLWPLLLLNPLLYSILLYFFFLNVDILTNSSNNFTFFYKFMMISPTPGWYTVIHTRQDRDIKQYLVESSIGPTFYQSLHNDRKLRKAERGVFIDWQQLKSTLSSPAINFLIGLTRFTFTPWLKNKIEFKFVIFEEYFIIRFIFLYTNLGIVNSSFRIIIHVIRWSEEISHS